MAHPIDKKHAVRSSYVDEFLALSVAAIKHSVASGTARRWKAEAKANGDDWDLARAASKRTEGEAGEFTTDFIEEFSVQVNQTFEMLKLEGDELPLESRVKTLTSLTDMMTKVNKLSGGNKKLDKRTIAIKVLKGLAKFVSTHYPDSSREFSDILTKFAPRLENELSD